MAIYVTKEDKNDSPDNAAFNNMQKATAKASDRLFESGRIFSESEYNTNATNKERSSYDEKAYQFLQELYKEDKAESPDIKDWDFGRYLSNLSNSYLEEKFIHARKDDPDYYGKAGEMLRSIYSDDAEQFKLSAYNVYSKDLSKDDESNVSIKAPREGKY
tara:strand:+ start:601 stop:1080 length:480 start_codon:yes stop_codon:yes gene_type:complete